MKPEKISYIAEYLLLFALLAAVLFKIPPWLLMLIIAAEMLMAGINIRENIRKDKLLHFMAANEKRSKWSKDDEERLNIIRRRIELSALQSQINPHFLYNTLDSIRGKALVDGNRDIAVMAEVLSKFFRYCIGNEEGLIKVREEILHIQDYFFIQKCRFEERFSLEIIAEDDGIYDYYMPKMTLQPLVENAMVHGLENVVRKGKIVIRLTHTNKKLIITIADNGAGMSQDTLMRLNEKMKGQFLNVNKKNMRHTGIALTNVNSRIRITFGEEYGIHYRSLLNHGTEAVLTIPCVDEFERIKYENILREEEKR
ncbi:MAG: histidine kinase [Eubacteriales bacterium]|nr:histidine kinase [Eubacteriales bacterium]